MNPIRAMGLFLGLCLGLVAILAFYPERASDSEIIAAPANGLQHLSSAESEPGRGLGSTPEPGHRVSTGTAHASTSKASPEASNNSTESPSAANPQMAMQLELTSKSRELGQGFIAAGKQLQDRADELKDIQRGDLTVSVTDTSGKLVRIRIPVTDFPELYKLHEEVMLLREITGEEDRRRQSLWKRTKESASQRGVDLPAPIGIESDTPVEERNDPR